MHGIAIELTQSNQTRVSSNYCYFRNSCPALKAAPRKVDRCGRSKPLEVIPPRPSTLSPRDRPFHTPVGESCNHRLDQYRSIGIDEPLFHANRIADQPETRELQREETNSSIMHKFFSIYLSVAALSSEAYVFLSRFTSLFSIPRYCNNFRLLFSNSPPIRFLFDYI